MRSGRSDPAPPDYRDSRGVVLNSTGCSRLGNEALLRGDSDRRSGAASTPPGTLHPRCRATRCVSPMRAGTAFPRERKDAEAMPTDRLCPRAMRISDRSQALPTTYRKTDARGAARTGQVNAAGRQRMGEPWRPGEQAPTVMPPGAGYREHNHVSCDLKAAGYRGSGEAARAGARSAGGGRSHRSCADRRAQRRAAGDIPGEPTHCVCGAVPTSSRPKRARATRTAWMVGI